MADQEFLQAVRKMRYYQKIYFSSRSQEALAKSKELEKQVDDHIASIYEPSLF